MADAEVAGLGASSPGSPASGARELEAESRIAIETSGFDVSPELLESSVRAVLAHAGLAGDISLTVLADAEITRLNRRYLGKDRPTDVIAFALGEEFAPLGDVYLGGDEAQRQAAAHGVELDEEFVRLAIHGTLHVLGHEHPEDENRASSPMFRLQERLVGEVMEKR